MVAETKTHKRVWEHKETLLLLEKWGDENIQLQLKSCTRKKPIWLEIVEYLQAAGYEDRDDSSYKTWIHTLISAHRSYKDECAKTGNATPKKKPAFFSPCFPKQQLNISPICHFACILHVETVWCCNILCQLQLHKREAEHEHKAALLSALVVQCEQVDQLTMFN